MASSGPARVLVLERSKVMGAGLRDLLARHGLQVFGPLTSADDVRGVLGWSRPELLVVGTSIDGNELEQLRDLLREHAPSALVVRLTVEEERAAADLVVRPDTSPTEFLRQVDELIGTQLPAPRPTPRQLREDQAARLASLTPRERRIAELVADGRTNRQIAAQLHLAEKTVRNYVSSILLKLDASNRTELAGILVGRRNGQR